MLAILLETQEMTIKLMDSLPDMVEEEEDWPVKTREISGVQLFESKTL